MACFSRPAWLFATSSDYLIGMNPSRRHFTFGVCSLAAAPLLAAKTNRQRVVVIGGGWGGLAAAKQLVLQAPELDIVLIEKNERFITLPLTNRWLVGLNDGQGHQSLRISATG